MYPLYSQPQLLTDSMENGSHRHNNSDPRWTVYKRLHHIQHIHLQLLQTIQGYSSQRTSSWQRRLYVNFREASECISSSFFFQDFTCISRKEEGKLEYGQGQKNGKSRPWSISSQLHLFTVLCTVNITWHHRLLGYMFSRPMRILFLYMALRAGD